MYVCVRWADAAVKGTRRTPENSCPIHSTERHDARLQLHAQPGAALCCVTGVAALSQLKGRASFPETKPHSLTSTSLKNMCIHTSGTSTILSLFCTAVAGTPRCRMRMWPGTLSCRTLDNRFVLIALPKAAAGTAWPSVFVGDPTGARCTHGGSEPLYRLDASDPEEVRASCARWRALPGWVEP